LSRGNSHASQKRIERTFPISEVNRIAEPEAQANLALQLDIMLGTQHDITK
jgi:hypothetical protein